MIGIDELTCRKMIPAYCSSNVIGLSQRTSVFCPIKSLNAIEKNKKLHEPNSINNSLQKI